MNGCICFLCLCPFACGCLGSCHAYQELLKVKVKAQEKMNSRCSGTTVPPMWHLSEVWCQPSPCQWSAALYDALILMQITQDKLIPSGFMITGSSSYAKLILTLMNDWREKIIPVVVTVQFSVASEEDRWWGFGHTDTIFMWWLVFELVLVIPITCESSNRKIL